MTAPHELDIRQLTMFLAVHLEWLIAHPEAPNLADDIAELATTARDVISPKTEFPKELGPCTEPGCGRTVYVTEAGNGMKGIDGIKGMDDVDGGLSYQVSCPAGHSWQPNQWLLLGGSQQEPGPVDQTRQKGVE